MIIQLKTILLFELSSLRWCKSSMVCRWSKLWGVSVFRTWSWWGVQVNHLMIGQGWSLGEFLRLGRWWLLLMSCLSRRGWTFKTSLINWTTAAVLYSGLLTPAMCKQLRRSYCSMGSFLSCRSVMSSLIWALDCTASETALHHTVLQGFPAGTDWLVWSPTLDFVTWNIWIYRGHGELNLDAALLTGTKAYGMSRKLGIIKRFNRLQFE